MDSQKQVVGPADATRIDLELRTDMNYWTRVLGVSETSLRDAVLRVGVQSSDVRAELRRRR
ncbi:hypothetical protein BJI69_13225 [Luteibacter rhizovicinus DSM 16549]|uniref:Uncharacterized protein n=1 Tax=Luteibacter rhizovicinus DSM 16549 TaxID=1440763 RepID=A0A0G9HKP6_9GAMM|nr:DUF3606 domain-containing protein [Luteibacter rhizovicinus]APG04761.1 hypothetical protein BJI69_13225 [Luteibacter rhizovicinus DSM 16549]KLD68252.1 hypothetical protein Y883_03970 [Luteibacter rhizovicinus DSM 16549]KLD76149.1 hypothetical protein Y886_22950 [Xanthomonas hyacinthi DSM 19077]